MPRDIIYPIYPAGHTAVERIAIKTRMTPGFCTVCGRFTAFRWSGENFRETGICLQCRSINRHRQLARVLCGSIAAWKKTHIRSVCGLRRCGDLSIYNTEADRSLHRQLASMPGYTCSEYCGPQYSPGQLVNGVRHEDLTCLSFPDSSVDIVLSSDVLEHVPVPYQAHREILRVLRPGGRHIFTVPFHQTQYFDEVLAEPSEGGPRLFRPPIYHMDPLSPEKGILVYTIFSLEMLLKLRKMGFRTHMYLLYHPALGILGPNGVVFEAIKQVEAEERNRLLSPLIAVAS